MNEPKRIEDVLIFSNPEAALGSPEVAHVVCSVIGRAKRALKRAVVRAAALAVQAWRYLKTKSDEAAAIHNRVMSAMDERYRKNPYHVRGVRGLL